MNRLIKAISTLVSPYLKLSSLLENGKRLINSLHIGLTGLEARYPNILKGMKLVVIGLILTSLLTCLISCAKQPQVQIKTVTLSPPESLLAETKVPQIQGTTNESLLIWALNLLEAVKSSNEDKRALRRWFEE